MRQLDERASIRSQNPRDKGFRPMKALLLFVSVFLIGLSASDLAAETVNAKVAYSLHSVSMQALRASKTLGQLAKGMPIGSVEREHVTDLRSEAHAFTEVTAQVNEMATIFAEMQDPRDREFVRERAQFHLPFWIESLDGIVKNINEELGAIRNPAVSAEAQKLRDNVIAFQARLRSFVW